MDNMEKIVSRLKTLENQIERLKTGEVGITFVPLTTPLTSTSWDGDTKGVTNGTQINFNTTFGVPSGAKAVMVAGYIGDDDDCFFGLKPTGDDQYSVRARLYGGDARNVEDFSGVVTLQSNACTYSVLTNAIGGVYLFVTGYWI